MANQLRETIMAFDKYGREEAESAAQARRMVDWSGWTARSVADRGMSFEAWSERQRARDKAAGATLTEAEAVERMDAMFPHTGGPSVDSKLFFGRRQPGEDKPGEPAAEIGRPSR